MNRNREMGEIVGFRRNALNDHANKFGTIVTTCKKHGCATIPGIDIRVDQKAAVSLWCAHWIGGDSTTTEHCKGTICAWQDLRITKK
jgi:hypothetical protein